MTVVENPDFAQGCSSSYRVGVGAVDRRAAAVAVLLGDQPGVDGAVIDRVVEAWRRNQGRIVVGLLSGPAWAPDHLPPIAL